jgi:ubiquinol-cytochrome c reductase iron-sulfur subunit
MRGAERFVAAALAVTILAGLGLTVVYVLGGQPQVEGVLLALALGGLGAALITWGNVLLPPPTQVVERRTLGPSHPEVREAAQAELARGGEQVGRRRFLVRLLVGAAAALGLAAIFPIRSLGPAPGRALFRTDWRPGLRLVDESGLPVHLGQLEVGSVITVFPEGHVGSVDAQTLLIRVIPEQLELTPERLAWVPGGNVAYSKVCTHAACPVGLFRSETNELLCPCHQSTFDVLRGAVPTFGPAARALPQLPVGVDEDGFLVAMDDFPEPVGPGFWNRGRLPDDPDDGADEA